MGAGIKGRRLHADKSFVSENLPTQNAPSRFKLTTVANKVLVIKSLFSFGVKTGYLTLNVGSFLKTPKAKETIAERILDIEDVRGLIKYGVKNERDRLMLAVVSLLSFRWFGFCILLHRMSDRSTSRAAIKLNFDLKKPPTQILNVSRLNAI